ncbi:MAG TPA: hypothetical protein PKA55_18905 [Rhodoblastus sp.]|nr:hypothetical protein [Rhodoblastus sp.]
MPRPSQFADAASQQGLSALTPQNLSGSGLSTVGLARRILELEGRIYPVEAHGHVGSALQWAPVFEAAPDSWGALTNEAEDIVAYWRIEALEPLAFDRALAGLLEPFDIHPRDCENLSQPGGYDIYLVRACIDPAWLEISTRRLFADSFFAAAERLALRGVCFREMAAVAQSDDECRICEDLGLSFLHDAPDDGAIFGGSFTKALLRLGPDLARKRPKLVQAYLPNAIG